MRPKPLIWNIQAEHLDEAEFLLEMWDNCVDSPKYTLTTLHEGPEERFLARVDGLLVGAEQTVERLLLPVLEEPDDDEFRTAAAAFTLLAGAGLEACEQVLLALERSETNEGLLGLARALSLSQRNGLVPWIGRDLDHAHGPALVGRLHAAASHRVDAGPRLIAWLAADTVEIRRAAARLARHTSAIEVLCLLGPATAADDVELRWAAMESGLIRAVPGMWELTCHEAFAAQTPAHHRAALSWVAMLGDRSIHQRLLAALHSPTADLLWAAGLSGRAEAVDMASELLAHEQFGRLAGEVVCTIAGLPSDDDRYWLDNGTVPLGDDPDEALPALEDDDLEADLTLRGDSSLRLPNPDSVRVWWAEQRTRFEPGLRYSRGRPLDGQQLQRDLAELPTRVRHHRALELAARTAGLAQVETRALTRVQVAQLDWIAGHFAQVDCQRGRSL